ncbi:hypothetical protein I4U23_003628 [Adineta vaga]|nr:hypothetical protein I4U23_003628 [Adineta vaga]
MSAKQSHRSTTSFIEKLTVWDGSRNGYIFTKQLDNTITFEYEPMTPMRSCSGMYSGGEPVFKQLKSNEWAKISTKLQEAKQHGKANKYGAKGDLVVQFQSDKLDESFIIAYHAEFHDELMNFVRPYKE